MSELGEIRVTLENILKQTTKTNGRVTDLEDAMETMADQMKDTRDVVFGDGERMTPGLVHQKSDIDVMLRQWSSLLKVGKWVAGTLATASVMLLVNVASNIIGGV